VYLLYIAPGKLLGGTAPILSDAFTVYSNPLPHVLILTAIVVGVATLALGLALVVRIREAYGTIEEDEILGVDDKPAVAPQHARHELAPHLPALQVVVPLLAAPLTVLLRRRAWRFGCWPWRPAGSRCLLIAALLWLQVLRQRRDLLRHRQLAAALGHRIPGRQAQSPSCWC
jgi:hypothetical protein